MKKHCVICGQEFESKSNHHIVCSPDCKRKRINELSRKKYVPKPLRQKYCHNCGEGFLTGQGRRRFCSYECSRYFERRIEEVRKFVRKRVPSKKKQHKTGYKKSHYKDTLILADFFREKSEMLTFTELLRRTGLKRAELKKRIRSSLYIGSLVKEGRRFRVSKLFVPCVNGVYEDFKRRHGA